MVKIYQRPQEVIKHKNTTMGRDRKLYILTGYSSIGDKCYDEIKRPENRQVCKSDSDR